jgi:hypothetical protein
MRIRSILLILATLFLSTLISNATVTNVACADDHDGAITCTNYAWGSDTLHIYGDQFWGPGHILGDFYTDSELDPTLTMANSIDNDTDFAWTDYHVNIFMSQSFTILTNSLSVYNDAVGDWTAQLTQQAASTGTNYMGIIDFYAGTALPIGDTLDFGYAIKFTGSTHYSFCEELVPTPEPSTLSLLVGGTLLLGGWTAAKRRHR